METIFREYALIQSVSLSTVLGFGENEKNSRIADFSSFLILIRKNSLLNNNAEPNHVETESK